MGVVEVHPLAYLGLEEEGGVVLAIVAHHAHQVELRLASPLLCHTVEQLPREREIRGRGRRQGGRGACRGEVCGIGERETEELVNVNTSTFLLT